MIIVILITDIEGDKNIILGNIWKHELDLNEVFPPTDQDSFPLRSRGWALWTALESVPRGLVSAIRLVQGTCLGGRWENVTRGARIENKNKTPE